MTAGTDIVCEVDRRKEFDRITSQTDEHKQTHTSIHMLELLVSGKNMHTNLYTYMIYGLHVHMHST